MSSAERPTNQKITEAHLHRRAVVYIRQSTAYQLQHNRESQRRQYGLAEHARTLGFAVVETIDEDLGRSGSGLVERPGFQRLVMSAQSSASRLPVWRVTVVIGTT